MTYRFRKLTFILIFSMLLGLLFPHATEAEAASYKFKYKDLIKSETVKFNGKTPTFYIDGEEFDCSDYPIMIIDGVSIGTIDLFAYACHVTYKFDEEKGKLVFKYNGNTVVLYLNSTKAKINDVDATADLAPMRVKYASSKIITNLVPMRFVAEGLGMEYTWHQDTTTVDIKTPIPLEIGGETINYLGTLGKIKFDGKSIKNDKVPSLVLSDNAVICLKTVAAAIPGFDYAFNDFTEELTITYGSVKLNMLLDSTLVYVNGLLDTCPVAPTRIYNGKTDTERVYIPGRYVFETLGFGYEWDSKSGTSIITTKDTTGQYTPDYTDIIVIDAPQGIKGVKDVIIDEDTLEEHEVENFRQTLNFPILEGIRTDLITFRDLLYDNLVSFDLSGNYMDFYRDNMPDNTGEAVIQLQIVYYEASDITRINMYTRTNEDNIILGHRDTYSPNTISFTFDRPGNLYDKIIILDAGHGDYDPGTVHGGYNEKDVNFSVVYTYCKQYFDDSDIKVYYSRYDDSLPALRTRAGLAARVDADFFISVHHNSNYNTSINGTSVYYSTKDTADFNGLTGKIMSDTFLANLTEALGTKNMGSINHNYVVVSEENSVPAVLLELGFMSNPDELKRVVKAKYQKKAAKCIYKTVLQFYEEYTKK